MPPFGGVALKVALLTLCLIPACELVPSSGSQRRPEQVGLQPGDVPTDVRRCPASGPIDRYLGDLKGKAPGAYRTVQDAWHQLQGEGATGAAVTVFGALEGACRAELGGAPGRSAASLVAVFRDQRAAAAAYQRGILGFPTPAPGQQVPGLVQGVATTLSENAWAVQRQVDGRALYVAWFQERAFAVFLVSTDLDLSESQRAAAAVEGRTH